MGTRVQRFEASKTEAMGRAVWGRRRQHGIGGAALWFRYLVLFAACLLPCALCVSGEDPYLTYVRSAPEFQRVNQAPKLLVGRWDTWVYMPWRYQWSIGEGDEGGRFCQEYGINGGFTDHGSGPLDWLQKYKLRFYNDHTAAKGFLYLRGANNKSNFKPFQNDPRAIRSGTDGPQPIDDAMLAKLKGIISQNMEKLKSSPMRIAYALDDEVSWGAFVVPIPWRLNADDKAYEDWLRLYYGGNPPPAQYVTPEFTRAQLGKSLEELDFSPLLDRITYNDSVWANFIGKLVSHANDVDPETPCGFVGGQMPSMWGGYDYAKLMKKIQYIEAYDIASSQAIIRSFNPQNAMPVVTAHFHNDAAGSANDIWWAWYYFAHGNRGIIGWVEGWFDGNKPRPWLDEFAPTLRELTRVQGPKMVGARWIHDGVAIYYSHPSIQVSWCLDIEPHGRTWVNRGSDNRLGTSHNCRKAWENMLTDSGIQYNFIPYDEVVVNGVPNEYKALILPACYALSDIEAQRIEAFCEQGGTVIADFACGLFDQHGKGRARGALDDLFGVSHNGSETKADFFGGRLWVETDQDAGFDYKKYSELFNTVPCKLEKGFAIAERGLKVENVKSVGKGKAVYVNLSPQRYLQYREEGRADEASREVFIKHVLSAGVKPWVKATSEGKRPLNCEVTYWSKGGRTLVFVLQNVPVSGGSAGGGKAEGLVLKKVPLDIEFAAPVRDVVDERTGKKLGDGRKFTLDFNGVEPVFISFQGAPPAK